MRPRPALITGRSLRGKPAPRPRRSPGPASEGPEPPEDPRAARLGACWAALGEPLPSRRPRKQGAADTQGERSVTMCGAAGTEPVPAPRPGLPARRRRPRPRPAPSAPPRHWPGALSLGPSPSGNGGDSGPWGCGEEGGRRPPGVGRCRAGGDLGSPAAGWGCGRAPVPLYSLPPLGPPDPWRGYPRGGAWCAAGMRLPGSVTYSESRTHAASLRRRTSGPRP